MHKSNFGRLFCAMESENIYNILHVDEYSATPKYLQIVDSIIKGIEECKLKENYVLPSINELGDELDIGRATAERAYRKLKELGIVKSYPGKGYFIANTNIEKRLKIFLMFNKLSAHKKIIYDSFVAALGENASIDFYIYNNEFARFKDILGNKKADYDYYIIIPHFLEGGHDAHALINSLPKDRIILLDKMLPGIEGLFGMVYEDFENDIYEALSKAAELLNKYHTLKIIFPEYTYYPQEIVKGFLRFCRDYTFNYSIVSNLHNEAIESGATYISVMEDDLVILIEKILDSHLEVGKHVGVLSYNETPLKKIILNGITTISTDFQAMGQEVARLVLENSKGHVKVPFHLTVRNSV